MDKELKELIESVLNKRDDSMLNPNIVDAMVRLSCAMTQLATSIDRLVENQD